MPGNDEYTLLLLHGEDLTDSSQYENAITNNGVIVSADQSKFGGKSLYFNGSSAYLQVQKLLSGSTQFTIDFWAFPTSQKSNTAWSHGGTNVSPVTGGGLELYSDGTFLYYCNGFLIHSGTYALNTWQHVALVGYDSTIKLYVNGVLTGTYTGSYDFANYPEIIGANASAFGGENFHGYIDEFRISNIARWTDDFVPPEEPYSITPQFPEIPSGFSAVRLTDTTVHLNWTTSERATGYKLYKNGNMLVTLVETSYTDTVDLFSGNTYAVTAYNDAGESDSTMLVYSSSPENPILYLVTDRTAEDVTSGKDKGSYMAIDMNRVGAAMNYVADRLKEAGYAPHISPKTDWKDGEWMTPADQSVYLEDLAELRKQFALLHSTPEVPPRILATGIKTNDGLTFAWANNIEKILIDIDMLLTNMTAGVFYAGELYSGEG